MTKSRTRKKQVSPMRQRQAILADGRRIQVAELYLKGFSYREIGVAVGCHWQTVHKDMLIIRTDWQQYSRRQYDEWVNEQLAKIDRVELEAWKGWERSQEDEVTKEVGVNKDGRHGKKVRRGQTGTPRFLEIALACVDRRTKLLGLGSQEDFDRASPDGGTLDGTATVVEVIVSEREQIPAVMEFAQFKAKATAVPPSVPPNM